jgi:hypothetical protein
VEIVIALLLIFSIPFIFRQAVQRPHRAVLLWLLLTPLSQDMLVVFGVNLRFVSFDRLAVLATTLALLTNGQFRQLFAGRFSKLEKAYLAFIGAYLFEAVVQFPLRDAFSVWSNAFDTYVIPFFWYLLVKYLLTRNDQYDLSFETHIVKTLAIVGLYCAVMAVFEGVTYIDLFPAPLAKGADVEGGETWRVNGPFWIPETLGQYLSWILLLMFYWWRSQASTGHRVGALQKCRRFGYSLALIAGMYFTMFRNVWGGFIGACSLRYLFSSRSRWTFVVVVALLSGGVGLSWGRITQTRLYQERLSNVENVYDRLGAWLYAFRAFSEHPVIGIGTGQIRHYIRDAQDRGDDLRVMDVLATYHPHNTFIAQLAELGLLGMVPFCLVIWFFLLEVIACVRLGVAPADAEFGLYAVSVAFAILGPALSDRCFEWAKLNGLMWVIFALVTSHRIKASYEASSIQLDEELDDAVLESDSRVVV